MFDTTKLNFGMENRGHNFKKGKPAEMVKWLYGELGFETSFKDNVDKPEKYGELVKFDQKEIAKNIDLDANEMKLR